MSQNNNITKLHESKDSQPQTGCPEGLSQGPSSTKACEETGEFYNRNLSQKPVKNETDQYFNAFGAGGGFKKNK
jgi:hypothetical protein